MIAALLAELHEAVRDHVQKFIHVRIRAGVRYFNHAVGWFDPAVLLRRRPLALNCFEISGYPHLPEAAGLGGADWAFTMMWRCARTYAHAYTAADV